MLQAKPPAHRAQEGPAHSIKVTEQGREGRAKGPEARRDSRRWTGHSKVGAGRSGHRFVAPHPPRHAQGQGNLAPSSGLLGADGETEARRGRDGSKVTQEPESPGRRGGGKERASLPPSLCTLQSPAAKGWLHIPALRPNHEKKSAGPRGQGCLCAGRGIALAERLLWETSHLREVSHPHKPQETQGRILPAASKLRFKAPRRDFCPTQKHCRTFLQPSSRKPPLHKPRPVRDASILNLFSAGAFSSRLILSGSMGKVFAIWVH